jgi:hypothetical protein
MAGTSAHRALAIAVVLGLLAGFVYAGVATFREYGKVFRAPPSSGGAATIDAMVAPIGLASALEMRTAVARAGWPSSEDVMLEPAGPSLSPQDMQQIYFAAGYLLYPRHVWLSTSEAESSHAVRHRIVIGRGQMELH